MERDLANLNLSQFNDKFAFQRESNDNLMAGLDPQISSLDPEMERDLSEFNLSQFNDKFAFQRDSDDDLMVGLSDSIAGPSGSLRV
jgi:hypothetical protein